MDGTIREAVDQVSELLAASGKPYKLALVSVSDLQLLEKNARFMKNETFTALRRNVEKDGDLSQLPFCHKAGDKWRVLSGNHRVQAAKAAGLEEVLVVYTDREMTRQEEVAVQLSHNAIVGEDDPVTLKELWQELASVDLKQYAGLSDETIGDLEKLSLSALSEAKLDFKEVTFLFIDEERDRLEEILKTATEGVDQQDYVVRWPDFDRLTRAMQTVKGAHNIGNAAVALSVILDIFEGHLEDMQSGFLDENGEAKHSEWVDLSTLTGHRTIPAKAAAVIARAIRRMMDAGDVTAKARWQALELWAADYLAGPNG